MTFAARMVRADAAPEGFTVEVARTLNDLMQVIALRSLVYMGEQACPFDEEYDGNDFAGATHLLLKLDGEPIGVARLRWFADFCKLERLAIHPAHRGGAGLKALATAAVRLAERKGYRRLMGHAQGRVVSFWRRSFNARPRRGGQGFRFSDFDYVELEFELHPPADAISIDTDPLILIRPEGAWDRPGVLDRSTARSVPAAA